MIENGKICTKHVHLWVWRKGKKNKHKPAKANHQFLARLVLVRHDPDLLDDVLPQARAGNVDAQYAAGLIFAEGRGVPPNPVEGYIWLSRAIAQGDKDAVVLRNMVTREAFEEGSGSELLDKNKFPAKMRAVHSSSALAVNVFDYWVSESNHYLLAALDIDDGSNAAIRFEGKFPTGLGGNPPNLDVVFELDNGQVIGIESKFTEWFTPKTQGKTPFKEKYFSFEQGVWAGVDLPDSQKLAEKMQQSEVSFYHLDAPQLLKHALGLATSLGNKFRLFYVYFDYAGDVGDIHRHEVRQFSEIVGNELGFKALSYQTLIGRLVNNKVGSDSYRSYLRDRYLYGAASA